MRAAIYCRRSVAIDAEDQTNSLEVQRKACEDYCRAKGWEVIPQRYDDAGISGATENRPGYQRLIKDCKSAKIDVVVVFRYDRLCRSVLHFSKVLKGLDDRGIMLVATSQNIDTSTSTGRLLVNIIASFAQHERDTISDRMKSFYAHRNAIGMLPVHIPYGFRKSDPMTAEIDPARFDVILRAYRERVNGVPFVLICDDLNLDGYRMPNGKPWRKEVLCAKLHKALEFCRTRPELADVYTTCFSKVRLVRRTTVRKSNLARVDNTDF
jgi:site-specific DNA recombinase